MAEQSSSSNLALFIDCTGQSEVCRRLLKELTGIDVKADDEAAVCWSVDNKYYTAEINIEHISSTSASDIAERRDCEAIVFICMLYEPHGLSKVKEIWDSLSEKCSPSICLVVGVCSGNEGEEPPEQILKWSIEFGFELVEWNTDGPKKNTGDDEEDSEDSLYNDGGVARISDALQAHTWPEMVMKNRKKAHTNGKAANSSGPNENTPSASIGDNGPSVEQILSRGVGNHGDPKEDGEVDGEESFEELFGRFAEMKAHAQSLPHEERKEYAEKVVKAFWQAIGGDEDELGDSD